MDWIKNLYIAGTQTIRAQDVGSNSLTEHKITKKQIPVGQLFAYTSRDIKTLNQRLKSTNVIRDDKFTDNVKNTVNNINTINISSNNHNIDKRSLYNLKFKSSDVGRGKYMSSIVTAVMHQDQVAPTDDGVLTTQEHMHLILNDHSNSNQALIMLSNSCKMNQMLDNTSPVGLEGTRPSDIKVSKSNASVDASQTSVVKHTHITRKEWKNKTTQCTDAGNIRKQQVMTNNCKSNIIKHNCNDKKFEQIQKKYHCVQCGKKYKVKKNLLLHVKIHQGEGFECKFCHKLFPRRQNMIEHERIQLSLFLLYVSAFSHRMCFCF